MTKLMTTKNKLLINHLNLKDGLQKFCQELTEQDLDITNLNFIKPITVDIELFKNGDTIVVSGKVNYQVLLCCVNCLENYEKKFSEKIYQEYVRIVTPIVDSTTRLEEIDFVREYYTSDFFDLTPLIRDTILLSIPIAPWCLENCTGVK